MLSTTRLDLRIQVLVLPNTRGQLPNDPRIQNQVVDEALVTCDAKQLYISSVCLKQQRILQAVISTLTFIRFWGNVQHEREEVLQKLGVVVGEMQTFAVLSGETKGKIKTEKTTTD